MDFVEGHENIVQYPIKDLIDKGVNICFGSDWPISTITPIDNMEVAVTRKPLGAGESVEGDNRSQCINIKQAIRGYTLGAAYALGIDKEVGSIEVGKKADIIVLNKNILECPSNEINQAKVTLTIVDGKTLFKAS